MPNFDSGRERRKRKSELGRKGTRCNRSFGLDTHHASRQGERSRLGSHSPILDLILLYDLMLQGPWIDLQTSNPNEVGLWHAWVVHHSSGVSLHPHDVHPEGISLTILSCPVFSPAPELAYRNPATASSRPRRGVGSAVHQTQVVHRHISHRKHDNRVPGGCQSAV